MFGSSGVFLGRCVFLTRIQCVRSVSVFVRRCRLTAVSRTHLLQPKWCWPVFDLWVCAEPTPDGTSHSLPVSGGISTYRHKQTHAHTLLKLCTSSSLLTASCLQAWYLLNHNHNRLVYTKHTHVHLEWRKVCLRANHSKHEHILNMLSQSDVTVGGASVTWQK